VNSTTVFLLEDHPGRLAEMMLVLHDVLPAWTIHVERDANRAIEWLKMHRGEVGLILLDHDLDSTLRDEASSIDHGCGRDVTAYLATEEPTCPVVIHTSNADAGDGMFFELHRAGWPVFRVYPFDEHRWVAREWKQTLQELIERDWLYREV
jgi:DNA-binding NarL/FixJ family response regulator